MLAWREGFDAANGDAPRPRPGSAKLVVGACREWPGAADRCQLGRAAQLLTRLGAAVGPAKRRPQLCARLRVLELRRGVREHLDGLLEKPEATRAPFGQSRCAQRRAERSGRTPGARQPEPFRRPPAG